MTPDELRQKRLDLGWTQATAAEHLGMSHRGYRYLEEGMTSAGNAAPLVPPPLAIAMLGLELVTAIENSTVTPGHLAQFRNAVRREAKLHPPRPKDSGPPLIPDPLSLQGEPR